MSALNPFHLAFPVRDIQATKDFFVHGLGCQVGRQAPRWIDFNFFGHQISAHLVDDEDEITTNEVDGDKVPVRHFGMVLPWEEWHALVHRLNQRQAVYLIAPKTRFEGEPGEQATFFIQDPSGNALEFKSFKRSEQLFAST